jgi:hypothetical protein
MIRGSTLAGKLSVPANRHQLLPRSKGRPQLDEILKTLAEHTGISPEQAKTALGAIVTFLKEHLPEGLSGQLMQSLPDAHDLASSFEENKAPEPSGGLLGAFVGLASKVFGEGGGEASKLLGMLQQSGLNLSQIEAFLPKVFELIKAHLPPELLEKILTLIPGFGPSPEKV